MKNNVSISNFSCVFLSGTIPDMIDPVSMCSKQAKEINLTKGHVKINVTFDVSVDYNPYEYTKNRTIHIGFRSKDISSPVMSSVKAEATFLRQGCCHINTILTIDSKLISKDKIYQLFISDGNLLADPSAVSCSLKFYKLPASKLSKMIRTDKVEIRLPTPNDEDFQNMNPDMVWLIYNLNLDKSLPEDLPSFYVTYYCEDGYSWSAPCVKGITEITGLHKTLSLYCQFTTKDKIKSHGEIYAVLYCLGQALTTFRCDTDNLDDCIVGCTQFIEDLPTNIKEKIAIVKRGKSKAYKVKEPGIDPLNSMIGLANIKQRIKTYLNLMRMDSLRKDRGLSHMKLPLHAMFLGSPGTGKTTVAKIFGQLLKEIGVLSKGHVVVRERATLIGEYYGTPSKLVNEALEEAKGGILFIDEAYQLYSPNDPKDPGKDVIGSLLTALADTENRDWMLILAGYTAPMQNMFKMNPGFSSRIPEANRYLFPDYSEKELLEIAISYLLAKDFILNKDAEKALVNVIAHDYKTRDSQFGNARYIINLIETKIFTNMADRLSSIECPTEEQLKIIEAVDIPEVQPKQTTKRKLGFAI